MSQCSKGLKYCYELFGPGVVRQLESGNVVRTLSTIFVINIEDFIVDNEFSQ